MAVAGKQKMTASDIKRLMKLKGWNQAELARKLELTEGSITRWLTGEHPPRGPARILMRQWLDEAIEESEKELESVGK